MKVYTRIYRTHNPYEESHGVSRLRENLTSGSDGEGLETGQVVPRQSFTRQIFFYGKQKIMHSNQQKTSWVNLNALLLFINTLHKYVPDNSKYKKETFEKAYI